jgi:hypothetical protein
MAASGREVRMQNLALIVVLAAKKRRQCPCGAVADHTYGVCLKCQARNAWRRKVTGTRRKAARRRLAHHAGSVARFLVDALTPLAIVSTALES